ncbi:MAG TPA: hypothetical protein VK849_03760 [Longimicrobiales bacterium]|nr:hypothetical protein [Longimicrobiales bacterium]
MAINTQKVVVGGLAAGVVMNVYDFVVNGVLLREQNEAVMATLGAEPPGAAMMVVYVVWDFIWALAIVWTYAAIRPRFGLGPKTAMLAGAQTWFLLMLSATFFVMTGIFGWGYFALGAVTALVNALLGGYVGGRLYTETQVL